MTATRHGSAVVELPSDLEILVTRQFDAPIELVFDVLTQPEHVRKWFSPDGEDLTVCTIDLRVGGEYHFVFVTADGAECSFRGTYLEIDPPRRMVATWVFEGRPHIESVESTDLHEDGGVTTMRITMAFKDKAARDDDIRGGFDGVQTSFDRMEDHIGSMSG
jgi:uncharacterized protein YndB with AHSA1/START domain